MIRRNERMRSARSGKSVAINGGVATTQATSSRSSAQRVCQQLWLPCLNEPGLSGAPPRSREIRRARVLLVPCARRRETAIPSADWLQRRARAASKSWAAPQRGRRDAASSHRTCTEAGHVPLRLRRYRMLRAARIRKSKSADAVLVKLGNVCPDPASLTKWGAHS